MKHSTGDQDGGQTLIYVALLMTTFLAFLAVAIDVGNVYAERRRMQNAADAGALAGAQELCNDNAGAAEAKAREYAIDRNGAQTASVDIQDGQVTVVAQETVNTFLASIVGWSTVDVGARASAACGGAKRGCNFWPIALGLDIWNKLWARGCDTVFVIINSDKTCGTDYDCDPDGDGDEDIFMGGGRGWLDLPFPDELLFPTPCHNNCGEKTRCFVNNDYPGWIELPACILSEAGVMGADFAAAGDQVGSTVRIPIFDGECDAAGALGDCGGTEAFHIVTFGCVNVIEYDKNYPVYDLGLEKWVKVEALIVSVSCDPACYAACGGTGGGPPQPGGLKGVSLTD